MFPRTAEIAGLALTTVIALAIAGCTASEDVEPSETGPTAATDTVSPQPQADTRQVDQEAVQHDYEDTVTSFPYDPADGRPFPEAAPSGTYPAAIEDVTDGEAAAYQWWGCTIIEAAWANARAGDSARAEATVAPVVDAINAGSPGISDWETQILDTVALHATNEATR